MVRMRPVFGLAVLSLALAVSASGQPKKGADGGNQLYVNVRTAVEAEEFPGVLVETLKTYVTSDEFKMNKKEVARAFETKLDIARASVEVNKDSHKLTWTIPVKDKITLTMSENVALTKQFRDVLEIVITDRQPVRNGKLVEKKQRILPSAPKGMEGEVEKEVVKLIADATIIFKQKGRPKETFTTAEKLHAADVEKAFKAEYDSPARAAKRKALAGRVAAEKSTFAYAYSPTASVWLTWTVPAAAGFDKSPDRADVEKELLAILRDALSDREYVAGVTTYQSLLTAADAKLVVDHTTIRYAVDPPSEIIDVLTSWPVACEPQRRRGFFFGRFVGLFGGKCKATSGRCTPCYTPHYAPCDPCRTTAVAVLPVPATPVAPWVAPQAPAYATLPTIPTVRAGVTHAVATVAARPRAISIAGLKPEDADGLFAAGSRQYLRGEYAEALENLTAGVALDPKDARIWYFKSMTEAAAGDVTAARLSAARGAVARRLPGQEAAVKDALKAVDEVQRTALLAGRPDDAVRLYDAGYRQFWAGKYAEALENLTAGVALDPKDARIWYYKALAEDALGRAAAARASALRAATERNGNRDQETAVIEALKAVQGPKRNALLTAWEK
ncbi:MAG: tetratricopeptide repeat protein [Planctomycetes bacterium]|nr:tetratricopeptide repeat protein [Planctomycetota bacterium]